MESRNKEFVEWRKAMNNNVFKDMKMEEHVEFQMKHLKSRYESTIQRLYEKIEEMSTDLNNLKREAEIMKLSAEKRNSVER